MSWLWTFGSVPELPAQQVLDECAGKGNDCLIVDVRTEGEFGRGHIDGATSCSLVPPWSFRTRVVETLARLDPDWQTDDRRIVFICLSAHRSISAVKLLTEMGRANNVFQLQGGMQAWRAAGLPEVTGDANSSSNSQQQQ